MRQDLGKEKVDSISRKTLIAMPQRKIPITPKNYLIWFDYFSGDNHELIRDVDHVIHTGGKFSDEINADLYRKHFEKGGKGEYFADSHREIQIILKEILSRILDTQNLTSEYQCKLKEFALQLETVHDLDGVRCVMDKLLSSTVEMIKSAEQFREELQEKTKISEELKKALAKANEEMLIDPLTKLYNRRAFDQKMEECIAAFHREGTVFSVVMMDIDFFKQFNDQHGHLLGDHALKFLGTLLIQELKGKDFIARYGGEEFVILFEGLSREEASLVANNFREKLASIKLQNTKSGELIGEMTVSAGVATLRDGDTLHTFMKRADDALYSAKRSGRNRVRTELEIAA